jgi:hypothetical protein
LESLESRFGQTCGLHRMVLVELNLLKLELFGFDKNGKLLKVDWRWY